MQVLEKGSGQKGWAQKLHCTGVGNGGNGCGALLLVEQSDVFETQVHIRDETDNHATFRCCACGCWTDLKRNTFSFRPRAQMYERDGRYSGDGAVPLGTHGPHE